MSFAISAVFISDFEQVFTCKEASDVNVTNFTNVDMHLVFHMLFVVTVNKNFTLTINIHVFELTLSLLFCFAFLFVCYSNISNFHILLKNYLLLFYLIYNF